MASGFVYETNVFMDYNREGDQISLPYVTTKDMLLRARENGYAVPAFNAENLEMLRGIMEAAEQARSPVIVQAGVKSLEFMGFYAFAAAIIRACERASVPAALHLDHGSGMAPAMRAYRAGFSSIMVDNSKLPYEENIKGTLQAVQACLPGGVPVEGELGSVGGKEDDHEADNLYTDPAQAAEYVALTGVSSLAVAIGTAHGVYKAVPKLDVSRLSAIAERVSVPLVLHGSSGLADDAVTDCIRRGICKVNFATELRQVYTKAIFAHLSENPGEFDLRVYEAPGVDAVRALCLHRIGVCMSGGRA